MKISKIKEAPLLRANFLINQDKSEKKGKLFKSIQPEIAKMSEIFGNDFDRNLHLILFNDIDFKDFKGLQKSRDRKVLYFITDFPQYIEKTDFIDNFSRILMDTSNSGTALEIFNSLNKQFKLSIENQFKLILSFILSDTEKYQEEAKSLILEKCKDVFKEKKANNLTQSTMNLLVMVLDNMNDEESANENTENDENSKKSQIEEYLKYFMCYDEDSNSCQTSADDIKQISDLEKILNSGTEDPIEIEKLFIELGPFIIGCKLDTSENKIINFSMDSKRLAEFIIYILNNPTIRFTEELKELNKIFLDSLNESNVFGNESNKIEYNKSLEESLNKDLSWDLDGIYELFQKQIDKIDVNQVLNYLDSPFFCIRDKKKFDFLINILLKLNILKEDSENSKDKFFKNLLFSKWNNEMNQIEFIDFMINNEEINEKSFYGLKRYNGAKISEDIDNKVLEKYNSPNIKNKFLINNWKYLELIEILLKLSKGEYYNSVKEIFKWPIQNIPEIFTITLLSINPDADEFLYDELAYEVIPKLLTSKNQNQELIEEIWTLNKNLVISILAKMWSAQQDLTNFSNIFDIINTKLPKTLQTLINSKYNNFSVNLAIYAAKRNLINLKEWLENRIIKVDDQFIEALLNYIKKNIILQCAGNSNSGIIEKAQLSSESLAIILEISIRCCEGNKLSQKTKKYCKEIYKNIFELFEELQLQSNNLEEIDKEAEKILSSMFEGELSVDNVIEKLVAYNNSKNQKENEKYISLLRCIFDEYKFYKSYPEKQIKIIGELFGKIINSQVIEGILLTIALKFVLEGIKTEKGIMYMFGTIALNQFIENISLWPNVMNSLLEIPQIKNEKELYQKLLNQYNEYKNKEKGIASENSKESLMESDDKYAEIATGIDHYLDKYDKENAKHYDKLKNKLSGPARSLEDISKSKSNNENTNTISEENINKIKLIFNSTKVNNIQDKVKELKLVLKDENIIKWFCQYFIKYQLITDNIPLFPKFYELFEQLKNKTVHKEIIKNLVTMINKHININTDSITEEKKSKEILECYGKWLGEYKISKDRPILAKDLDFRTLIIYSCENGKLHLSIPFICSILKYAPNSKVFKDTNPWISSILNLLAELWGNENVNNSVKNEIKNLFKVFKKEVSNCVPKTKELGEYNIKTNSSFYNTDIDKDSFSKKISELEDYINNLLGTFNSDPNLLSNNKSFKSQDIIEILSEILSNSVQSLIPDIITKNIETSMGTAIFLVNKDFMFEKDEKKYISALENTMKMLAISLCNMNAKELLKAKVDTEIIKVINKKNLFLTEKTIGKIKQQPNQEFLSIGLEYIQNVIKEEAPKKLFENSLVKEVREKRKNCNLNSSNNVFIDNKHLNEYQKIFSLLPGKLHPNEKSISEEENKIYEKFGEMYKSLNNKDESMKNKNSFLNTIYRILKEVLDSKDKNSNYKICMKNIQMMGAKVDTNYDEDDQQLICLEKIVSESKINDQNLEIELASTTLDYAIDSIKNGNILWLNIYSHILKGWITLNPHISEIIMQTLLNYDDIKIRYKYKLYHSFIKKKILNNKRLEEELIKIIKENSSDLLARKLLKLIAKSKNINPYYYDSHSNTYYTLFNSKNQIQIANSSKKPEASFEQIIRAYLRKQMGKITIKDLKEIKDDMKNWNKNDNSENILYNSILRISAICLKETLEGQYNYNTCYSPDNAALLMHLIFHSKENVDKPKLFKNILKDITIIIQKELKSNKKNNQRACFRFLYNLLYYLNKCPNDEFIFGSENKKINYIFKIYEVLKNLSPLTCPEFTMGWLELISSNVFISNFLEQPTHIHQKKKDKTEKSDKLEKYLSLLMDILNYLDTKKNDIIYKYDFIIFIEKLYQFFFYLSNSYPEFVSNNYYQLITCLSGYDTDFIQLKNIILSAYPRNIVLSEFKHQSKSQDEKYDDSSILSIDNNIISNAIKKNAHISMETSQILEKLELKDSIDNYIKEDKEIYLDNINNVLKQKTDKDVSKILNSIVLYWCHSKHRQHLVEKKIKTKEIAYKFYKNILCKLSESNRNILINAILNCIRYPSPDTIAYCILLQELIFESKIDDIKENIINNLFERALYKPIPWGIRFLINNMYPKEKFQTILKYFVDKYKLDNNIISSIVNNCKENNLINFIDE